MNDLSTTHSTSPFLGRTAIQFLLATFGLTWLVWIPVALVQPDQSPWLVALVLFGAFMPSIMGVVFGVVLTNPAQRIEFWRRIIDLRRIKLRYWLFILTFAPVLNIVGAIVSYMSGGPEFVLKPELYESVGAVFGLLLFTLIGGPLAEELGWRGLLLPDLLERHNALRASLMIGVIWVVWHLPLFWIEGTSQNTQGLFTLLGFQWIVEVIALSIIVSWLFINTGFSIASAVLIHFMDNFSFTVFAGPDYQREPVAAGVITGLYVLTAIVILLLTDFRTLRARREG